MPGAERRPGPGDHHHLHRRLLRDGLQLRDQPLHQPERQRIPRLRPVQRQPRHPVPIGPQQHRPPPVMAGLVPAIHDFSAGRTLFHKLPHFTPIRHPPHPIPSSRGPRSGPWRSRPTAPHDPRHPVIRPLCRIARPAPCHREPAQRAGRSGHARTPTPSRHREARAAGRGDPGQPHRTTHATPTSPHPIPSSRGPRSGPWRSRPTAPHDPPPSRHREARVAGRGDPGEPHRTPHPIPSSRGPHSGPWRSRRTAPHDPRHPRFAPPHPVIARPAQRAVAIQANRTARPTPPPRPTPSRHREARAAGRGDPGEPHHPTHATPTSPHPANPLLPSRLMIGRGRSAFQPA